MDSKLFSSAERIVEVDQLYKDNSDWASFFIANDLGVPYAYLATSGHGTLNEQGEKILRSTWIALCDLLGVDYEAEYDSFESMQIISEVKNES